MAEYRLLACLDDCNPYNNEGIDSFDDQFKIPKEVVAERPRHVSHSFGSCVADDEDGYETIWMRLLAIVPSVHDPSKGPDWIKTLLILRWKPKPGATNGEHVVTLIAYRPPAVLRTALFKFWDDEDTWTRAIFDPYVLVSLALASWYERLDQLAWDIIDLIHAEEKAVFEQSAETGREPITDINLQRLHNRASNAIFAIEALDAAIRVADLALQHHEAFSPGTRTARWHNTHRALGYCAELFQTARLRTLSSAARVDNIVNLAFHLGSAYDSRRGLRDSRSMRIIAIVGLFFLPFTAITSIFGTQFFVAVDADEGRSPHMSVNPDIWLLWSTALPITGTIVAGWLAYENWSHMRSFGLRVPRLKGPRTTNYSGEIEMQPILGAHQ